MNVARLSIRRLKLINSYVLHERRHADGVFRVFCLHRASVTNTAVNGWSFYRRPAVFYDARAEFFTRVRKIAKSGY